LQPFGDVGDSVRVYLVSSLKLDTFLLTHLGGEGSRTSPGALVIIAENISCKLNSLCTKNRGSQQIIIALE